MNKEKIYKVYIIKCKINEKFYIGQTYLTLQDRFSKHKTSAKSGKDTKLYRCMRKYGIENFYISLLETCKNQEELTNREYFYINLYKMIKIF